MPTDGVAALAEEGTKMAEAKVEEPVDMPSIEQQIVELGFAGWIRINSRIWKAPIGGYFLGPHGAWLAMKRRCAEVNRAD